MSMAGIVEEMNEDEREKLPYDFDLYFDIKTKQQLIDEMLQLKSSLNMMQELIEIHNIDLGGEDE